MANGKRQIQVENFFYIANKQIKTLQKGSHGLNWRETIILFCKSHFFSCNGGHIMILAIARASASRVSSCSCFVRCKHSQ